MTLKDVPPEARGIPWKKWMQQQIEAWKAEARERGIGTSKEAFEMSLPVATKRDAYGWKSL